MIDVLVAPSWTGNLGEKEQGLLLWEGSLGESCSHGKGDLEQDVTWAIRVHFQAKSRCSNCAMFWKGDCSARALVLIRVAAAAGKGRCDGLERLPGPCWHLSAALVLRPSYSSPWGHRFCFKDPQRRKVHAKIKQLNKNPAPLPTPEQWHVLFPVIHSYIFFLHPNKKLFSHFLALSALCRCWLTHRQSC